MRRRVPLPAAAKEPKRRRGLCVPTDFQEGCPNVNCPANQLVSSRRSSKTAKDARGHGAARATRPHKRRRPSARGAGRAAQRNTLAQGGPGASPGELWPLSFSGKWRAAGMTSQRAARVKHGRSTAPKVICQIIIIIHNFHTKCGKKRRTRLWVRRF